MGTHSGESMCIVPYHSYGCNGPATSMQQVGIWQILTRGQHIGDRREHQCRMQWFGQNFEEMTLLFRFIEQSAGARLARKQQKLASLITRLEEDGELYAIHTGKNYVDDG